MKYKIPWAAYAMEYPISAPACLWWGIGCQLTRSDVEDIAPHSTEVGPSSGAGVNKTILVKKNAKKESFKKHIKLRLNKTW